jgi:hypothetical protein
MPTAEHYWQSPFVDWINAVPADWDLYVFTMRESRLKARVPAVLEALCLWRPFEAKASLTGPLAGQKGVFWIALQPRHARAAVEMLPRLGYTQAVDRLAPADLAAPGETAAGGEVKWKGRLYYAMRVFQQDEGEFRLQAPDKRVFLLEKSPGQVEAVTGYRGNSRELSRRGLPVEDARLLVNLTSPAGCVDAGARFLEPFAGTGGLVIEARKAGFAVASLDIDPKIRHGLRRLNPSHTLGDAARLPFASGVFTAIAAEPPYSDAAFDMLCRALAEFQRVLAPNGRLALLVPRPQEPLLAKRAAQLGLRLFLSAPINRKGTEVSVLAWKKEGF